MNVLINFSTLKSGGGQTVGMNFLYALFNMTFHDIDFYFFVAENSAIHRFLEEKKYTNYHIVSSNPIKRIIFEILFSKRYLNQNHIDIIYSYFGIGFFTKKILQVSGSADSNLYFPEVDFWSHYKGIKRFKKKIIDIYRIWGLKRADAVVFENQALEKRSYELYQLRNTKFIKPSINFHFDNKEYYLPNYIDKDIPICLFLCGWQLNKNIMEIPNLALELKKRSQKFHFLITAPLDNSMECRQFNALVQNNKVEDMVSIVGQVKKEELASLYRQINYVFLLSKLESFSNNIIESWFFKKPLIVSDELWSRSICNDAASYVDRNSITDIINKLLELEKNKNLREAIVDNGSKALQTYPTIEEKIKEEVRYLKYVYENN